MKQIRLTKWDPQHPSSDLDCAVASKTQSSTSHQASFQSAAPNLQQRWHSSRLSVALWADRFQSRSSDNTWNKETKQPCETHTHIHFGSDLEVFAPFIAAQWPPGWFQSPLLMVTRTLEPFPDALCWRTPGTRETNIHLQWHTQLANKGDTTWAGAWCFCG